MGQLENVLDYLAFVAESRPLGVLLDQAPLKIASCVGAEVASLYLREGNGQELVLRGNVGFPLGARGKVRLQVGEGITGKAVELQVPVAADRAADHAAYRGFPELEEERFPAFLAVPIIGPTGPLGAVVVQRGGEPFTQAEITLVAALTAPISSGIRLARVLDDLRDRPRRAGGGTHKVTLPGVPVVRGAAMGAIAALRRPAISPKRAARPEDADDFTAALDTAQRALRSLHDLAERRGYEEQMRSIESYLLMLEDQRLRDRTFEAIADGVSLAAALGEVARDATRTAEEREVEFLIDRARDLEQLCDALVMLASPDSRAELPSKPVVVANELSIYDLLVSVRAQPAAFVLAERQPDGQARALLELLGVPAITDVAGAFRWISPGDIALVDADHGFLILNPSRADIAAFRADKKRARDSLPSRAE